MPHGGLHVDPGLTIAIAIAVGIVCQSLAHHLRVPGIVLLLGAGVLLGPDVSGVIEPAALGGALHTLVGFAVAVILFEGGLNLNVRRLRREAKVIRQLVTVGGLVTAVGGMLAARLIMGWDWRPSILFGTLVIVTGPTVITPLLRRIRPSRAVSTVLEAEGVFIDAIGAIIAVVALEVAISPSGTTVATGFANVFVRLGFGLVFGVLGGLLLGALLRVRRLVPEGMENVFTLGLVLALFQGSNAVVPESGIMTVIMAGLVLGNFQTPVQRELLDFKEQLTVMMIGMLFVLLAADVRLSEIRALGWAGVLTVLALMLVVRPATVAVSTRGSSLSLREKAFLSWLAPRGIVAAAIASLFADTLNAAGIPGGDQMRALVFLVIIMTVLLQGLSGGLVAKVLGVRRPQSGYIVLGANELARTVGRVLRQAGEEVTLLDANADACSAAEREGFRVVYGNALEERNLQRAGIESCSACVALSPSANVNILFARKARELKAPRIYVALEKKNENLSPANVRDLGGRVLFGTPVHLDLWTHRIAQGSASLERWKRTGSPKAAEETPASPLAEGNAGIGILLVRATAPALHDDKTLFKEGDELMLAIYRDRREEVVGWLERQGWTPMAADERDATPDRPSRSSSGMWPAARA